MPQTHLSVEAFAVDTDIGNGGAFVNVFACVGQQVGCKTAFAVAAI